MGKHRVAVFVGAIAVAVGFLTGCTGGDQASTPTPTSTRAPVPTDAPSTVGQWSAVAESQMSNWNTWGEAWESVSCGAIEDLASASVDCMVLVFQAIDMVKHSESWWAALTTPGLSQFISTVPPEEVADLVVASQEAATAAVTAGVEWTDAMCGLTPSDECPGLSTTLGEALDGYVDQLAAWEPHMAS